MERTDVRIDSRVAKDLRKYVFEKYGYLHGKFKEEVESAIKAHIRGNRIVITPVQPAMNNTDESSSEDTIRFEKREIVTTMKPAKKKISEATRPAIRGYDDLY